MCLVSFITVVAAQRPGSSVPRQEKLLNGLRVLMWTDPSATDVRASIRVHAGASFDPQGKEGVMKLLAENVFPTAESRNFFSEDLGGNVEVVTNYDYIQINATAKASEFVTLLETLAQAVSNPTIDAETTTALKRALTEKLTALEKDPAYVAERASTKRLFGTFPYGRPQMGSVTSLERIDFADLLYAKNRFFTADNATVAISGNFNGDLGFRAARRYFGAWQKSDKRVPSTFRQPDPPEKQPVQLTLAGAGPFSSFAFRGLSRNDQDYVASLVLEKIVAARLQRVSPGATFSHQARVLPGVVVINAGGAMEFPFEQLSTKVSEAEFGRARGEVAAEIAKRSVMDDWLDADTYSVKADADRQAIQSITLADVQRVADRLGKNPIASAVILSSAAAQQ